MDKKIEISLKQKAFLFLTYSKSRIVQQLISVLPVICYLIIFHTLVLGAHLIDSLVISFGIAMVILGLALFMEGLLIGIMPLGENIGVKLPLKAGILSIIVFSFIIGIGATIAEPSIGILRTAGSFIKPWDAPLLYLLLNRYSGILIISIAIGVGIAVIGGMLRFLYDISLKPFIYILFSVLLSISVWGIFDKNIMHLTGLAWDCGAVTTGPVTVPLIISLGIGISRSTGKEDDSLIGFGVVTLASAFPILAVMIAGLFINMDLPQPMSEEAFFSESNKEYAEYILGSNMDSKNNYDNEDGVNYESSISIDTILSKFKMAAQAIIPLTLFIIIVFLFFLREKFLHKDELIFGIIISILGLSLFYLGMEYGLARIGSQIGRILPSSYSTVIAVEDKKIIDNFDKSILEKAIDEKGETAPFFYKKTKDKVVTVPFEEDKYDHINMSYTYIPKRGPLFRAKSSGLFIVFLFAFIMGYGATFAEPALNALGLKVEELTIGTVKKQNLKQAVAIGVGFGIAIGLSKILWNIPLVYLLVPSYLLLLYLTHISSEDFVNISWDSAGVTTGPVTVPLVLVMGLGIGSQVGIVEGFGILSMASAYPILGVLIMGIYFKKKTRNLLLMQRLNEESETVS